MNLINDLYVMKPLERSRFIISNLSGNGNKRIRQEILTKIHNKKIPVAKCGVYNLIDDLNEYFEKRTKELLLSAITTVEVNHE